MTKSPRTSPRSASSASSASSPSGSSWLSLLVSSALGTRARTTSTEIRAENARLARGPMRLVVQTFPDDARGPKARPISSVQRNVTADELRRGVRVNVFDPSGRDSTRVLAWVERGEADLELDGHAAKPSRRSIVGNAPSRTDGPVRIVLQGSLRAALRAAGPWPQRRATPRHVAAGPGRCAYQLCVPATAYQQRRAGLTPWRGSRAAPSRDARSRAARPRPARRRRSERRCRWR